VSVLLAFGAIIGGVVLLIVRAFAVDEVRGRVQRHIKATVEATIASLPQELQEEWADEWRAELAAVISMPLTAARYARGLRRAAAELAGEQPGVARVRGPLARAQRARDLADRRRRSFFTAIEVAATIAVEVSERFSPAAHATPMQDASSQTPPKNRGTNDLAKDASCG
jgi:hypothetical protein